MGKLIYPIDNVNGEDHRQVDISNRINDSPLLPLDLSRTSTDFPFIHRSTSNDDTPTSPMDLSERTNHTTTRQMSTDYFYEEPEIIIQPKLDWHYRSVKDLAKNHLPFLSGDGPQRTPIRVSVPMQSNTPMYLGIAIVTHDHEFHPSKVIVPAKTKVKLPEFSHDNNLDYLQFDECNSTDRFDRINRHIYMQISSAEHQEQSKDVRIHMFNLYQNQTINKEIIEAKQLNLCKLSFWLCHFDHGRYIPVSRPSFSSIIQEKKITTRSRISQHVPYQIVLPGPYLSTSTECLSPEDTNDDDSQNLVSPVSN